MKKYKSSNINILKGSNPKVLVITDALPMSAYERGDVMAKPAHELFLKIAGDNNLSEENFIFVTPCPPIPIELDGSESKVSKFIAEYHEEFAKVVSKEKAYVQAVVTLGKAGTRQLAGKAIQITKARGTFCTLSLTDELPVLPLLGPFHVLRRPELMDTYVADFRQIKALEEVGWSVEEYTNGCGTDKYKWCNDITPLIENPPAAIALDCETIGLDWHSEGFQILNVSITPKKGVSYVIPLSVEYATNKNLHGVQTPKWMKELTEKDVRRSIRQIKELLSDARVAVVGHNLKFDIHALNTIGVEVKNWYLDTMQMAFAIDENMTSKSLDDCARRWLPTHSGYADSFNQKTDKSRMDLVQHDEMLAYAGGDTDVTYRLAGVMLPMVKEDSKNAECFFKIQMPALRTFVAMEEVGVKIDTEALATLGQVLKVREKELYDELLQEVPAKVLREFEGNWNFGSQKFLVACLFGPDAIKDPETNKRLKPIRYTSSTEKLPDDQKVPSTSAKDHLPYFEHIPFVRKLMQYSKLQKVRSTYVGTPSSVEVTRIKPLKNGKLPKAISDILEEKGVVIPKTKTVRRRTKLFDQPQTVTTPKRTLQVDVYGNVNSLDSTDASGFWQYLNKERHTIHTSFLLHATNTGRTSCLRADSIVVTKSGEKRADEIAIGDLVWTHKNRWRPVVNLFLKPEEQMFTVEFTNGSVLHMTLGHKLLTNCGKWLSLIDVCIKETSQGSTVTLEGSRTISDEPINHKNSSSRAEDHLTHCSGDSNKRVVGGGVCETESTQVFSLENGRQEPNDREGSGGASQLQRRLSRWQRILDEGGGSQTLLRSSYRNGGDDRCSSVEAEEHGYSSHRRKSDEQLPSQPSLSLKSGPQGDTREVQEVAKPIRIKRVKPCGSHPVYDFEVEEDHSYEAAGCFSHNSRNPNLQNTPKRGEMAKEFRRIFLPPVDGWKFLELDYSQIELRVAAWMAGESKMIQIYREGGDIHSATAAAVTGIPFSKFSAGRKDSTLLKDVVKEWPGAEKYLMSMSSSERAKATVKQYCDIKRYQAKAVNFGYLYGMWWRKFKVYAKTDYGIEYTDQEAEKTRIDFFKNYPALEKWHKKMKSAATNNGYVRALHGSLRRLPNVESFDDSIIQGSERQAVNAPVQRFASDLGLIAVNRIFRDAPKDMIKPVLFIHDAIVPIIHPDFVDEAASAIKYYMENPPLKSWFSLACPFPLVADVSIGDNLGEMEELHGIEAKRPSWFQAGLKHKDLNEDELEQLKFLKKTRALLED